LKFTQVCGTIYLGKCILIDTPHD